MAKFTWGPAGMDLPRLFTENFYASRASVLSKSPTGFIMEYNDASNTRIEVEGSGLSYDTSGLPNAGFIETWTASSSLGFMGAVTNLKMSAVALIAAAMTPGRDDDAFYGVVLSGKDVMTGSRGNDRLTGYAGSDTLIGGLGGDALEGGKGADRFVYKSIKDSSAKAGKSDYIWDFSHAQKDKIDLRAIDADATQAGNQAFTFNGDQKFSKAGQLRYEFVKDPQEGSKGLNVLGDINGDGVADFKIHLSGISKIDKGDFYL